MNFLLFLKKKKYKKNFLSSSLLYNIKKTVIYVDFFTLTCLFRILKIDIYIDKNKII